MRTAPNNTLRATSRSRYLALMFKKSMLQAVALLLGQLGTLASAAGCIGCIVASIAPIVMLVLMLNAEQPINDRDLSTAGSFLLAGVASFFVAVLGVASCIGCAHIKRHARATCILPPLSQAEVDSLPAEDILVRGAAEPEDTRQLGLLRAATQAGEEPNRLLLRATVPTDANRESKA